MGLKPSADGNGELAYPDGRHAYLDGRHAYVEGRPNPELA